MYWTLELASKLEDAPWPATKAELLDYANRSGLPQEVLENLEELFHILPTTLKKVILKIKTVFQRTRNLDLNI